jgi:ATP-binding cassette subfamily C protein
LSIILSQALISILDLVGLALIMQLVVGFQNSNEGQTSSILQTAPFFGQLFSSVDSTILLGAVLIIFIFKGVLSLILHSVNIRLMENETIKLVKRLSRLIFAFRTSSYRKLSSQEISHTLFNSTEMVLRDTLVPVSVILSDTVLIVLIGINLGISAKVLFLPTAFYFLLIFISLRRVEKRKTRNSYRIQWETEISGRTRVLETILSLRELYVSAKLNLMLSKIIELRSESIKAGGVVALAQLRPKYLYEMALFGGIGVIALVSNLFDQKDSILTFLVLFIISASRMIPSLMRIQYYLGIFQKSKEQTQKMFQILEINETRSGEIAEYLCSPPTAPNELTFLSEIVIEDASFKYDATQEYPTLNGINLKVSGGEAIAIVGPSGSGKSTLVDIILGYQAPDTGHVLISGVSPRNCFSLWPGKVAYVPQKVPMYEGTLFENIAVGVELSDSNSAEVRKRVENLLDKVELGEFFRRQEKGIDCLVSELGSNLSGGQVQRIGIARALFSEPLILVLDETTSSLDSATEHEVMKYINSLKGEVTIVIVSHRLSTIQACDRIYYLEHGKFIAEGKFDDVRKTVPNFEDQIKQLKI